MMVLIPNEWQEIKIALSEGTHTIKFLYSKDFTASYGRDAVWIDDITVVATNLTRTFNDHTYRYYPLNLTWHDAKNYCENLEGHLAIVESQEENDFIRDNYAGVFINARPFLGGTDEEVERVWKWVDGKTFNEVGYTNWLPGQPNNSDGTWNDADDWLHVSGFVCEWNY